MLLLASCNGKKQSGVDDIASSHAAPLIVPLNINEGYLVNPITGDSIQPIINSLGDTLKTGVPIPAKGKIIDPRSVAKPKVIPAGKPEIVPVPQNVHKIPVNLTVIPLNKDSLKTFTPGVDTSSFVLTNTAGDTIPTGVPLPAYGKVMPCIQPQPVRALPPLMKDYANINVKYLDVEQGLNTTLIVSILEDSHGYIWFGTFGGGVSKYDGETFTHFTNKEMGIRSNVITSILEDSQGNFWFGTGYGVVIYNGKTFTHFTEKEGLSDKCIESILEDSHGNLWFGSWGGGVSKFDGNTFTHFTPKEGLSHSYVFSILEDSHGNVWFGTWGGGISIYVGNTFTHLTQKQGLINDRVWSMLEDNHGNIWIGTDDGLSRYDGETIINFTEEDGLSDNHVRTILEDSHGNVWFGTHGGVSKYNGETFTNFTENEGLSNNRVRSIMEDRQGNLWFGTESGGVSIYYGTDFTYFTQQEGLSDFGILSPLEDSHGNFWFGTWGGGVNRYDGETFVHFTQKEGLIDDIVPCILEDCQKNIWFGTYGGLCKYDGKTFTHFTTNEGLSDNIILTMLEDSQGNLWIGTREGGVSMYDGETFVHFTQKQGLISNTVQSILEDSHGNIWIATDGGGLCMYDGETFTHYTEKEGLSNKCVKFIMEDSRGLLWLGTCTGVNMFDGECFTYLTQNKGLRENNMASIVEDGDNHIWVGTWHGLFRLAFEPEIASSKINSLSFHNPVIQAYGLQEGLKSTGFNNNSVLLDSKDRIWWGTDKGLAMLDINDLKMPVEPPVMYLGRIDINGQFIDYRHLDDINGRKMKFDSVPLFHNYPLNLELPHNRNNLTFYFAAIDWSAAQKLQYSYIMEGLDEEWTAPTAEANAVYRNIPHGWYTFKVRAIGSAQKWSEPVEYTFRILPPFWLRWWAYMIYGFISLLMIRWYRAFLIKREKINADLKIKEVEVSKMQELDHMKSRFFANISHEFRTPLTLIQGPIEELKRELPDLPEKARELLHFMKRNTQRLQHLINQILDISKLETGKVKLQVSEGNLEQFIRPIILSFLSMAESKNIKYVYDLHVTSDIVFFDSDKVEKIITNLISNAFKFTPEGGKIRVSFEYIPSSVDHTPEYITIKVVDTGRGIPMESLYRVFDRFYQISDSDSRIAEGTGLGLALTKELVDLYRGEISVDSQEGKGSTFTVKLPVSKDLFTEEERAAISTPQDTDADPSTRVLDQQGSEILDVEEEFDRETADHRPVLLIVEDNIDLMNYLSQNLENHYRILTAINGKKGLDEAIKYIPDLIISDVMMPEMDGLEMSGKLKTDERTNHIPVIMLTAKADRDSKLEGLQTGADDYMIKPFDQEELQVRIKNLLEQRQRLREKFRKEFAADLSGLEASPEDQFLKKVHDILNGHIDEPEYTIEQLSGELHLSRSQVFRKVMAVTSFSPKELLRNIRLKKAAILFHGGHKNVAQVMYEVGFNNPSYFAKCFSELFGMNPSQYIIMLGS
jgi:signal transduction histidine kinase/ligand-binding sensor domain-containing protein/DNA-binding response OmpR family regulator